MKSSVENAIEGIRQTFAPSPLTIIEDGGGGAYVFIEQVEVNEKFVQSETWLGGHITAQFPHADIYPGFVRGDLKRVDSAALQAPISAGHTFQGRSAVQVSRRSNGRDPHRETAAMKFLKILEFLRQS